MPATEQGLQRLLEFFLYGMLRAADSFGNTPLFMRTVEEQALRRLMTVNMPGFQESMDAVETCRAYTMAVDESGLFDGADTVFRGETGRVEAEIGDRCVYRKVCTMRHDEQLPVYCIRAAALAEMLRIRLEEDFRWKLDAFGRPCRITLQRRG